MLVSTNNNENASSSSSSNIVSKIAQIVQPKPQQHQPIDIRACALKREQIQKLHNTPDFTKTLIGCFVRVKDATNHKIGRIVGVQDSTNVVFGHDHVYGNTFQLDDATEYALSSISDEPAVESEIQNWLMALLNRGKSCPSAEELAKKCAEINAQLIWPLTPSKDFNSETDNETRGEDRNKSTAIIEQEGEQEEGLLMREEDGLQIDDEQLEEDHVEEFVENIEMGENAEMEDQMEIGENQTIGFDREGGQEHVEEVDPTVDSTPQNGVATTNDEHQRVDLYCDEEIQAEEEEMKVSEEEEQDGKEQSVEEDKQNEVEDNIGREETTLDAEKQGEGKQQNQKKGNKVDSLDALWPIVVTKTDILQLIHMPTFNSLLKDFFVRVKDDGRTLEGNEGEGENDGKHMLAKFYKVDNSDTIDCLDDIFYRKKFFLWHPNAKADIFEVELDTVSDYPPTEGEFADWVTAEASPMKSKKRVYLPTHSFSRGKKRQLDDLMRRAMKKEALQQNEGINAKNAAIYRTERKLTTREQLLRIFLRRSQLIRLLQRPNFEKTVIGAFVRFYFNVPMVDGNGQTYPSEHFKYKIVQIVGVQPAEHPYAISQLVVNKELKLEWDNDKLVLSGRISSTSDTVPTEEEFTDWIRSKIESDHSIPSLRFMVSKSATIQLGLERAEQPSPPSPINSTALSIPSSSASTAVVSNENGNIEEQTMKTDGTEKESKSRKSLKEEEPKREGRPKLERSAKNKPSPPTAVPPKKKRLNEKKNATVAPPRPGPSPIPSTSKGRTTPQNLRQQPKGFEILKRVSKKMVAKGSSSSTSVSKKTTKKQGGAEENGAKNEENGDFWHSLSPLDRKMLSQNGFSATVTIRIGNKEFDRVVHLTKLKLANRTKLPINGHLDVGECGPSTSTGRFTAVGDDGEAAAATIQVKAGRPIQFETMANNQLAEETGTATVEVRSGESISLSALLAHSNDHSYSMSGGE